MRSFFKQVLAVIVGLTLFQVILFVLLLLFITATTAAITKQVKDGFGDGFGQTEVVQVEPNSVLRIDLDAQVPERTTWDDFAFSMNGFELEEAVGLHEMTRAIRHAAEDDDIKGIYLRMGACPNGLATLEVIRQELEDFQASGKFVVAFGDVVTQRSYYVSAGASEIFLHPEGALMLPGLGTELAFFGDAFDRLGIEMEVFKVGKYKSAVEPFIGTEASPENEEQLLALLGDLQSTMVTNIAADRGLPANRVDAIMDSLTASDPTGARRTGMVDDLLYVDQVEDVLRDRLGLEADAEIEMITLPKYVKTLDRPEAEHRFAVVFAEGSIVDGPGERGQIGSKSMLSTLRDVRRDDDIDGLVLRVNSPGGSALASDIIWRELGLVAEDMPVLASMGDVAASGGYYISCGADRIFAEPNTVTGSIGVFGLIPNMTAFFNDKLGVTFDEITVNDHATMNGVTSPLDDYESMIVQRGVDSVYETFLHRVAVGRGMERDAVHAIAQGRVWTGNQAVENGLVDEVGGLTDALDHLASTLDVEDYEVVAFPKKKSPFQEIFGDMYGDVRARIVEHELGPWAPALDQVETLREIQPGIQARMPYVMEIQ